MRRKSLSGLRIGTEMNSTSTSPPDNTRYLNTVASIFHGLQFLIVFSLIIWMNSKPKEPGMWWSTMANSSVSLVGSDPGVFLFHKTVRMWNRMQNSSSDALKIDVKQLRAGEVDVRWLIASFFLLSCVFQGVDGIWFDIDSGMKLRFLEYCITASCMIIGIAVESGINEIYTVVLMFVLTWITMILGLIAEVTMDIAENYEKSFPNFGKWAWVVPHAAGWVTCLSAYAPIIDMFEENKRASQASPPGFVNVIVYLQLVLFMSFGFVQTYSLVCRTLYDKNKLDGHKVTVETMYIVLSFVAKTLLAWLIFSPIIVSVM